MSYNNFKAELRRIGKVQADVAKLLNCDLGTANRKINRKSKMDLDEAVLIQMVWFPHLSIEYLFAINKDKLK